MLDNSIRKLAQAAKMRLNRASKANNLDTNKTDSKIIKINSNFATYKNLYNGVYEVVRLEENDDELYEKVCMLLDEDYDNPHILGELIDVKVFKKLNEAEKDRYIINLADKYLELKSRYIKSHNLKISI